MSYDLNFYKRKTDSISKNDIEQYLSSLPNMTTNENETQWFYQNENTGVYCTFEYYELDEADVNVETESFEGFADTNFAFNINFIRPQFFGRECFPIVDKFAKDLNLYILNPQGDGEPKEYESGVLEKQWAESNLNFAKTNFEEWGLHYLDLDKSNYYWVFSNKRTELQNKLGEEYFVPGIFYIKLKNENEINTLSVWPEHIPYVLPKVDFVIVQKVKKKLFGKKKEEGIIKYSDLISNLGKYFIDEETYKIIHPENAYSISKEFNSLPLLGSFNDFGEGISVDKIVNVKNE